MTSVLSTWWRSDSHQHRFDYLLGEQSSKQFYCVVFGILLAIYSVMWAGTLLTADGPTSVVGKICVSTISVVVGAGAVLEFWNWWPSSRTSFVMLCALDIALFVGAMQMSNDLIGLLILFMYGPVGLLIGFRHGARALTMHSAAAALAIIVLASECWLDAPINAITVGEVAVGLTVLVVGLPLASHVIFDLYRVQAIDAQFDPLTELLNRRGLPPRWQHMCAAGKSGDWLMVICADIDRFKPINDTHGHRIGDAVLRRTARHLVDVVGPAAHVARTGGDEFTVLVRMAEDDEAERLRRADGVRRAVRMDRESGAITMSVGMAAVRFDDTVGTAPADLLRWLMADADSAMYAAKRLGGDRTLDASTLVESRTRDRHDSEGDDDSDDRAEFA